MNFQQIITGSKIRISDIDTNYVYYIEQCYQGLFWITSKDGYNSYEGEGIKNIEKAISKIKCMIKNNLKENTCL